jgi:predicted nucleotidyltransferase
MAIDWKRFEPGNAEVRKFLEEFRRRSRDQQDILGVAVFGSYARNEATATSDADLIIVATQPSAYLQDALCASKFGTVIDKKIENYGRLTSLRVWYSGGLEVEYGFTDQTWCELPTDPGSRQVVAGGMVILEERDSIFSRMEESD